ncbi:polyamine ABC transporter ATP-binding protein [Falsiroseomonas bella]|uniref:Polyamine ABC transporter ATP-binding protein n=1 Tax=Falsiroseomonas bella TaxID=2184016 RepID=A0A317FF82_9PROT|nr:ABC transporter ATP-binding protein [Falsiroseomonas bella]PWS37764.1 polyamine ABC transporter ATP-binding protein [Falsiroseomonas bella]
MSVAETRPGPAPHLAAAGLVKRFGSFTALDRVELSAQRGELLTLLGPSGCGKTTLLRVIAGFLQHDEGTLRLAGRSLDGTPPEARNFGMVFQSYAIFPHLSVAENVAYGLRARRVPREAAERKVAAALERVRLGNLGARYPDALSGGQKQRVGLARAMVIEPDLLLMDEPLSNLDAKLRIEMRDEIRRMQRELGITTIYVTHDQEEALAISDRIAVMERGHIRQFATPREVFESPAHAFVAEFVGGCNWLDATLLQDGAGAAARIGAGAAFALPAATRGAEGPARAALRTEDLRLATPEDPPGCCLEGRVGSLAYLGPRTRMRVIIGPGDAAVEADLPSALPLPNEGEPVRLSFEPHRLRVFAPESGVRIA